MRTLTAEQRDEIVRRYDKGDPLKVIAADFGTYPDFVSELAHRRGRLPRYQKCAQTLVLKMRPQDLAELKKLAKEQRVRPEIIAREAISAYLGLIR